MIHDVEAKPSQSQEPAQCTLNFGSALCTVGNIKLLLDVRASQVFYVNDPSRSMAHKSMAIP